MLCKFQQWLINQGIHWCGKQRPEYPHCKDCPEFEEQEMGTTYCTATDETVIIDMKGKLKDGD